MRRHEYRILAVQSDNLDDFLSPERGTVAERSSRAEEYRAYWGTRWIMLPNPQYGSWEDPIIGFDYNLPDEERLRLKHEALRTR